ncbi:response regulator [Alcanivorax quisquiliarum]|uniref:Response regulator transcription factor n=1 Tax=Alcanivorax quisquiliarum TaxID=2933565 RepID=A0ABT0E841_9GAMM|nr:response regulator transcription factor [Alcanivorax quisquiliarum]MCK0538012.1 response regulator transcription factor [Alcanivorax quisquiliarum]
MNTALILEDHAESRAWLTELVAEAFPGINIVVHTTLADAVACVEHQHFCLALLDISLPDGSGIDLVRRLRESNANTYVVMASIFDDDEHLFAALQAGAQGYVLKDQPRERLIAHLQGIIRGEPPLSPSIARRMLRHFRATPPPALPKSELPQALSERETEVLHFLARGFTRGDIAQALGITPNTVAGHVKNIYRKLDVSGRAEATLYAVRLGVVDGEPH